MTKTYSIMQGMLAGRLQGCVQNLVGQQDGLTDLLQPLDAKGHVLPIPDQKATRKIRKERKEQEARKGAIP